jgi:hypothetical protein
MAGALHAALRSVSMQLSQLSTWFQFALSWATKSLLSSPDIHCTSGEPGEVHLDRGITSCGTVEATGRIGYSPVIFCLIPYRL